MSTTELRTANETVRGSMILTAEDAALFKRIVTYLAAAGKPPKVAVIIRDALRCYAKELNLID